MARNYELTWHKPRKCWKKSFQNKIYYLATGKCRGKTDDIGYQLALREWREIQQSFRNYSAELSSTFSPGVCFTDPRNLGMSSDPRPSESKKTEKRISALIDIFLESRRKEAELEQITFKTYDESTAGCSWRWPRISRLYR